MMASVPEGKGEQCLHVEVKLKSKGAFVRIDTIRDQVAEWLPYQFCKLRIGQQIYDYGIVLITCISHHDLTSESKTR